MRSQANLKQVLASSEDHILALIADTSLASSVLELLSENDNRDIFTQTSLSAWPGLARLLRRVRENTGALLDDLEAIKHQLDDRVC